MFVVLRMEPLMYGSVLRAPRSQEKVHGFCVTIFNSCCCLPIAQVLLTAEPWAHSPNPLWFSFLSVFSVKLAKGNRKQPGCSLTLSCNWISSTNRISSIFSKCSVSRECSGRRQQIHIYSQFCFVGQYVTRFAGNHAPKETSSHPESHECGPHSSYSHQRSDFPHSHWDYSLNYS